MERLETGPILPPPSADDECQTSSTATTSSYPPPQFTEASAVIPSSFPHYGPCHLPNPPSSSSASSFTSSSYPSQRQQQQHDERDADFETMLKQIFPYCPTDHIRELLGPKPTREKAEEVANRLAQDGSTAASNHGNVSSLRNLSSSFASTVAVSASASASSSSSAATGPLSTASVKSNLRLLLNMTSNRPLDARDVLDDDIYSFDVAKDEIRRIRKLAADILVTSDTTMNRENVRYMERSAGGGNGDDEDEYYQEDNVMYRSARGALYDKQDLTSLVKMSVRKTPEVRSLIYDAIKPNALFEIFADDEMMQIIDVFRPVTFKGGDVIMRQGDVGSEFYVVEWGQLCEHVEGDMTKSKVHSRGLTFGELSLVFGSPSASTITADTDVRVWILERDVYRSVVRSIRWEQYQEKLNFIENCVVGDRLFVDRFDFQHIEDLAIAAKVDNFEEGDVILREGDLVETFYIVRSGIITRYKGESGGNEVKIGTVEESKAFGTTSLLKGVGSPYTYKASSRVKVFFLTRHDFESIMGSVKDAFDNNTAMPSVSRSTWRETSRSTIFTSSSLQSLYKCDLDDLDFYNVLGRGAFGHVMLVQSRRTKRLFALKAQSKYNICKKKYLQDQVLKEFEIATQVEHKTLLRIHCAMQDKKFVYFLLDLLPGGTLMDKLSKHPNLKHRRAFDEDVTKFYAASVVLAFEKLHGCMIAYRDLKPENIVLDKKGYGVLVDFGIAKYVEGLTYTFCGTPDYLSPEIIRCTGHNWAVDYWALGIFLFEMTKGAPPFRVNGRSPIEREKKILKGFELVNVPQYFTSGLTDLISKLLIAEHTKRLGRMQNGVQGIKNHRWFAGFDWEGFENQSLKAPLPPNLPRDIKEIGSVMDSRLKQEVDATPYSEWWPDLTLDMQRTYAA